MKKIEEENMETIHQLTLKLKKELGLAWIRFLKSKATTPGHEQLGPTFVDLEAWQIFTEIMLKNVRKTGSPMQLTQCFTLLLRTSTTSLSLLSKRSMRGVHVQ